MICQRIENDINIMLETLMSFLNHMIMPYPSSERAKRYYGQLRRNVAGLLFAREELHLTLNLLTSQDQSFNEIKVSHTLNRYI